VTSDLHLSYAVNYLLFLNQCINIPYVMPFLQDTLLNSNLDELIVTVILCNAIQLMEATKLIDYIYMQYIFMKTKVQKK